jgi:hypothetical protein
MARCTKIVTGTGAVTAQLLAAGSASIFYGYSATSAGNVAPYYIKLYWEGTGTAPASLGGAQSTTLPVAATAVPQLTIPVSYTAATNIGAFFINDTPLNNGGRIWYWITTTLADSTAQAVLATGGDVVTLIFD